MSETPTVTITFDDASQRISLTGCDGQSLLLSYSTAVDLAYALLDVLCAYDMAQVVCEPGREHEMRHRIGLT